MKIKKKLVHFASICASFFTNTIFLFLSLFFTGCIIVSFFVYAVSEPSPIFLPSNLATNFCILTCIVVTLVVFFLLYKLNTKLDNVSLRKFQVVVLIFYVAIQLAFVLLFPINARSDSRKIQETALELLNGNKSSFEPGGYLSFYPNNIGITFYLVLIYKFLSTNMLVPRLINIIFTTLGVIYSSSLFRILTNAKDRSYRFSIIIFALAPVSIIMNNYIYGDVASTCLCIMGLYYGVKYYKTMKYKNLLFSALCLIIGYFLRCSGALFIIALIVYFLLLSLSNKDFFKRGIVAVILLGLTTFNLPLLAFDYIGVKSGYLKESVNVDSQPVIRWVNMGYPDNKTLGYWDGGHSSHVFHSICKDNKERAARILTDEFKDKLFKTPVKDTVYGYVKKTYWVWTEGTYQVNYYPLTIPNRPEFKMLYNTPLKPMLANPRSKFRLGLIGLLFSQNLLLLSFFIMYCFYAFKTKNRSMLLPILVILMFFLFYIIWEIKSRYIFGSYPMLIIVTITIMDIIFNKFSRGVKSND